MGGGRGGGGYVAPPGGQIMALGAREGPQRVYLTTRVPDLRCLLHDIAIFVHILPQGTHTVRIARGSGRSDCRRPF